MLPCAAWVINENANKKILIIQQNNKQIRNKYIINITVDYDINICTQYIMLEQSIGSTDREYIESACVAIVSAQGERKPAKTILCVYIYLKRI